MKISDLAVNHDYYCSESNYYSNEAKQGYSKWPEFYNEYFDCDIDMNLIFRWDIKKHDSGEYHMEMFMIQQRKGIFVPIEIKSVNDNDCDSILELLHKHLDKLKKIWMPII